MRILTASALQKRISSIGIVYYIFIFLTGAGIPGMKVFGNIFKSKRTYIERQKMIQSAEHLLGVKGIFTVEVAAILFCVHTAVGAAASRKGGTKFCTR